MNLSFIIKIKISLYLLFTLRIGRFNLKHLKPCTVTLTRPFSCMNRLKNTYITKSYNILLPVFYTFFIHWNEFLNLKFWIICYLHKLFDIIYTWNHQLVAWFSIFHLIVSLNILWMPFVTHPIWNYMLSCNYISNQIALNIYYDLA